MPSSLAAQFEPEIGDDAADDGEGRGDHHPGMARVIGEPGAGDQYDGLAERIGRAEHVLRAGHPIAVEQEHRDDAAEDEQHERRQRRPAAIDAGALGERTLRCARR